MIRNQLFIAAALFAGVAIGYFVKDGGALGDRPLPDEDKGYVAASKIGDAGEAASIQALRARIAELEKMLAAQDEKEGSAEGEKLSDEELAAKKRDEAGPVGHIREMREHMEWLKKERPEEYKQLTEAMARWRQRRIERTNGKLDYLAGVNTEKLTDEQRQTHERYQDLLVRREELEEKMASQEMTDEDRADIMRDMFQTQHEMGHLARAEREMLIGQTVEALGYSGKDAEEVQAAFSEILSVTETRGGGPGGPPPGGPGGAGGKP